MSDLLKSLGAFITKPNVANASKKVATPDDEKYKEISERNLNKVAKHYSDMVTPDIMYALMGIHDYRCPDWGSRHFGRMQNLCTNILDIEIHSDDGMLPDDTDKRPYFKLFFWLNIFRPIAMKRIMQREDWLEATMIDFDRIAVEMGGCGQSTREAVEIALFKTINSEAGDPVLDIYHDACHIESTYFGHPLHLEIQRTVMGRSVAFTTSMSRCSRENMLPKWVARMEKNLNVSGFTSVLPSDQKGDEVSVLD